MDAPEKFGTILKQGSYPGTQLKPLREPQAELGEQGLVHIAGPSHICPH